MSPGSNPQQGRGQTTPSSPEGLSEIGLPRGEESDAERIREEETRSRVVVLLNRSIDSADETAASELNELLEDTGWQGQLARAALIEELISYEESAIRRIVDNESPSWCVLFAGHISDFVTAKCGKEMTEKQRGRFLECIENYLSIAAFEDSWGTGAVKLLEHAVTIVNDLFLWSQEPILTQAERARLGSAYLALLSKPDLLFQDSELYSKLVSPISKMVEAFVRLGTPKRGELLKALFTRVNRLCKQFVEEEGEEGPFIRDPTDQIADLADDRGSWPQPDAEASSPEEELKYEVEVQEALQSTHDTESDPEGELSPEQDDGLYGDESYAELEEEDLEDEEFEDEELEDDEFDDEDWRGEDDQLEAWRGGGSAEGSDASEFRNKGLDALEIQDFEMKEAVEADAALLGMQASLAKALRDCPSLGKDVDFWSNLVFEQPALDAGSSYFTQGYARTSIKALGELLLAIPLSMQEEGAVVVNFVALLEIEDELVELYGMDIAAAYGNQIGALAENEYIIELQSECSDELKEEGYGAITELADATIRSMLTASLEEDWTILESLSELGSSGDEMRALLDNFIRRVWGNTVSDAPSQ